MLESYEEKLDVNSLIKNVMVRRGINRTQTMAYLRSQIPKEGYYQDKIKKAIKKRYPSAFVAKIAQGAFSQSGLPDVMTIIDGHYFGFEIKRPVFGEPSKVQLRTIQWIEQAGGTAAIVTWPEECFKIIERWKAHGKTSEI